MTELEKQLKEDLKKVLIEGNEGPCSFCKHKINDCNEYCKHYVKGTGMHDEKGTYYDWDWTCMDWDFGTCDRLINSPCYNCLETDFSNWTYNDKRKV